MARAAAKKKPARKQGASRKSAPARKGAPGGLWLVLGLVLGAFVAFLWHLWELRQDARHATPVAATAPAAAGTPAGGKGGGEAGKPAGQEPRFEFYTLLPNQEVMPGSRPAPAQPAATPAKPEEGPAFLLQAGSFRSEAEADKRRAAILLLGMPVKVVKVAGKPGESWYRVVVGPFKGKQAASDARASLKGSGVEALVIKQG